MFASQLISYQSRVVYDNNILYAIDTQCLGIFLNNNSEIKRK